MTRLVLFHHVRGLTEGVASFAERVREYGHAVDTPDLFGGRTFATLDEGISHAREIGFDEVLQRARASQIDQPRDVVFGGMSMGVTSAETLMLETSEARGGLFLHGFVAPEYLDVSWRAEIPAQMHAMEDDPWVRDDGDLAAARELASADTGIEVFTYSGSGHLFTDVTDQDFNAVACELVLERVVDFLDRCG